MIVIVIFCCFQMNNMKVFSIEDDMIGESLMNIDQCSSATKSDNARGEHENVKIDDRMVCMLKIVFCREKR